MELEFYYHNLLNLSLIFRGQIFRPASQEVCISYTDIESTSNNQIFRQVNLTILLIVKYYIPSALTNNHPILLLLLLIITYIRKEGACFTNHTSLMSNVLITFMLKEEGSKQHTVKTGIVKSL